MTFTLEDTGAISSTQSVMFDVTPGDQFYIWSDLDAGAISSLTNVGLVDAFNTLTMSFSTRRGADFCLRAGTRGDVASERCVARRAGAPPPLTEKVVTTASREGDAPRSQFWARLAARSVALPNRG